MQQINRLLTGCVVGILLLLLSCTKHFDSYNTDNTGFPDELKAYDYNIYGIPLKVIQQGIYFNYDWGQGKNWPFQIIQNLSADMFCGYFHNYQPFNAGLNNSSYYLMDGWNSTMWEYTYGYIMTEIKRTEDLTRDDRPDFYAITKILKVMTMHRVTDYYGPIIYSSFGKSNVGTMPDSQEEVYFHFFDELEEAVQLLLEFDGYEHFSTYNILMDENRNNYAQWIKFANSLRLRLAIRISMVAPQKAHDEVQRALAPENGGLLELVDDLIAVRTNGTSYNNPLGEINKAWGEVFMNANMESILKGYNDPRLKKYFLPATNPSIAGEYRGIRQGTGFNHRRYRQHSKSTISQISDAVLMTAAEVWFLRAEAALRGWTAENVAFCYRRGVETSFEQWNVSDVESYLNSDNYALDFEDTITPSYSIQAHCRVTPQWDESASNQEKLERIITQKWIACYPEGCEAWAEQRRTGFPRLFPVLVNNSNGTIETESMIRRLNFPVSIISSNPAQYDALLKKLGGADTGGTRLWWDVEKKDIF